MADETQKRLDRLAGGNGGGGGIPLPLLFQGLLETLVDEGSVTTARAAVVAESAVGFNSQRVGATWATWKDLARDALAQLEARELVVRCNGGWSLGPKFKEGAELVVIPKRGAQSPERVRILNAVARAEENAESHRRRRLHDLATSSNIRRITAKDSMDELRESMEKFGWVRELPAIEDERGIVVVGHRRLKVADELGIDPVVETITFGDGAEANARRLRLAITSNLGTKPFTPEDRAKMAEYLYGERGWTMAKIAEALKVSQRTISTDLGGLEVASKPPRPAGGRPKGSTGPKDPALAERIQRLCWIEGKSQKDIISVTSKSSSMVSKYAGQDARPMNEGLEAAKQRYFADPRRRRGRRDDVQPTPVALVARPVADESEAGDYPDGSFTLVPWIERLCSDPLRVAPLSVM